MGKGRLNNWRWWLQIIPLGLLVVATYAPLSEPLRGILQWVALAGTLLFLLTDSPAPRNSFLRLLIAVAAFLLLARLFSFDKELVFLGVLGVWGGTEFWAVFKREHAEYLAERDRHQRRSESS